MSEFHFSVVEHVAKHLPDETKRRLGERKMKLSPTPTIGKRNGCRRCDAHTYTQFKPQCSLCQENPA